MRQVVEEIRALYEQNQRDVYASHYIFRILQLKIIFPILCSKQSGNGCVIYRNAARGSEHEVYPSIQMRHAALERNKRCLLAYLYVTHQSHCCSDIL